jgi:hypothetical protein
MKKGINSTAILAIVLSLPKEHPNRNKLIDLMNSALRNKGTLPLGKEEKFIGIIKDLKKEGML